MNIWDVTSDLHVKDTAKHSCHHDGPATNWPQGNSIAMWQPHGVKWQTPDDDVQQTHDGCEATLEDGPTSVRQHRMLWPLDKTYVLSEVRQMLLYHWVCLLPIYLAKCVTCFFIIEFVYCPDPALAPVEGGDWARTLCASMALRWE